jgi:hypothetical protein
LKRRCGGLGHARAALAAEGEPLGVRESAGRAQDGEARSTSPAERHRGRILEGAPRTGHAPRSLIVPSACSDHNSIPISACVVVALVTCRCCDAPVQLAAAAVAISRAGPPVQQLVQSPDDQIHPPAPVAGLSPVEILPVLLPSRRGVALFAPVAPAGSVFVPSPRRFRSATRRCRPVAEAGPGAHLGTTSRQSAPTSRQRQPLV